MQGGGLQRTGLGAMLSMSCLPLLHALQTASPHRRQWCRRRVDKVNFSPHAMQAGTAASGTHLGAKPFTGEPGESGAAVSASTALAMARRHAAATSADGADTTNDFFGVLI